MQEFTFTIKNKNGLHARPAGEIANVSRSYESSVVIRCGEKVANGKRLLSVMSLGAKCGASLHFEIEGKDEEAVRDALYSTCEEKLG
jgi:phosphocarrier protein